MLLENHDHEHDHEHEIRELTDDELEQVSGGAIRETTCPCKRHSPPPPETY